MTSITINLDHFCYFKSIAGSFELTENPWSFWLLAKEMDQTYFEWSWNNQSWQTVLPQDKNYGFFVLTQGKELVAFALYFAPEQENFVHLLKLMVAPSFRLKGLGYFFFLQTIEDWKKTIKKEVYLEVQENNISAYSLYKKIGFDILCLKKHFYGHGHNAFAMKLSF